MAKEKDVQFDTDSQLALLPEDDSTFPKNVALASPYGLANPTLRKMRCLHVIQHAVLEQFMLRNPEFNVRNSASITEDHIAKGSTVFDIPEEQIMANLGYLDKTKYYSMNQVLGIFKELSDETIGFDSFGIIRDKSDIESWEGFFKIIGSAERIGGYFRFSMPPKMVHRIVNPQVSFRSSVDWNAFSHKFSPSIYEMCDFYYQNHQQYTDWIEFERLKTMSGVTYKAYSKVKERIINPALTNINESSKLELFIRLEETCFDEEAKKRGGRNPVTHIRFHVSRKLGFTKDPHKLKAEIRLASQKTELKSYGIAKNQLDAVLDEIRDNDGNLIIPYLSWCIRKAAELKRMCSHKAKDNNVFGGYFRKRIIRDCKADWCAIQELIKDYLLQTEGISQEFVDESCMENKIEEVRESVKNAIVDIYIDGLNDSGFNFFKEDFLKFLEQEIPDAYEKYIDGNLGDSIKNLNEEGRFLLHLYIDQNENLFTAEHYFRVLNATKGKLIL